MKFTDLFIKRPILSIVICLIILLVGIISYLRLPLSQFPRMDSSVLAIKTNYPGASADVIENFVTDPLEKAISGIGGIDYITSSSSYGQSSIIVFLRLGYDINTALSDINTQISSVLWQLPADINTPSVQENDPNAFPVYYLSFVAQGISPVAMGNFLSTVISPMLTSIPGVGEVDVYGHNDYAMRIWLDPQLMAARNITAADVYNALMTNNVQATSGQLRNKLQQFDVYATTDLHTVDQFNNLILSEQNNIPIRIRDIGYAELGAINDTISIYADNQPGTVIRIVPSSTANPLTVSTDISKQLPSISAALPKTIKMKFSSDMSTFIAKSIQDVNKTLIESVIIVFLVIFLILGSWRSVCIPLIAIPLSVIGSCSLLLVLGYSINTLTLLAFVLSIGLVVDDAIVVTENIYRHISLGKTAFQAAIEGAREIRFAIIAMTITLAAAYLPIGFTPGITGALFTEFAFTLVCTVIISGIVALILSPMMCSKFLTKESSETGLAVKLDYFFHVIFQYYRKILLFCFSIRWLVLLFGIIIYVMGVLLVLHLKSELAPAEDQGFLFAVLNGPAAATLKYTEKYSQQIENIYNKTPEVMHSIIINGSQGVNSAYTVAILKPWNERKTSAFALMNKWTPEMWAIPGVLAYPFNKSPLPGSSGFNPINYVIKTTDSYTDLQKVAQQFMQKINQWGGMTHVDNDLKIDKPTLNLTINRSLAANLGIQMTDISKTLRIFLAQPVVTFFGMDQQNYEVIPQLQEIYMKNPTDLKNFYIKTSTPNTLIPLSNLANLTEQVAPRSLNHFQGVRSTTITGGLAPGVSLGEALKHLNQIAAEVLPSGYSHDYAQLLRQYVDASGKMGQVFFFALIFIYLILAAQFESFMDPLIVICSVPLSLTGALLLLKLNHVTLNIYTEIGLITLLGLMSKQAILIVEFANQLQEEHGKPFKEAILEASCQRLRPIIMTSLAMILGALPLVFAFGPGAVSRFQIGLTIVSGLSIGTMLTLFIIPVVYYLFAANKEKQI